MSARCETCGGLVAPDAEWCGQCYAPIGPAAPEPAAPDPRSPGWDCPACGRSNPLEADACTSCGTSFGRLLEEPDPARSMDPGRARRLSLLFPGLGHVAAGRGAEGLARMVAFAWILGAGLSVVLIRRGRGLGPGTILLVAYGLAAAALYVVTAVDAERAQAGRPPLLSSRALAVGLGGVLLVTLIVPFLLR